MALIMLEKAEMIVIELVVTDVRQRAKLKAAIYDRLYFRLNASYLEVMESLTRMINEMMEILYQVMDEVQVEQLRTTIHEVDSHRYEKYQ